MRALPLVMAGFAASVTTSLAVWGAVEIDARCSLHFEVLEHRLIVTNAPASLVNVAAEAAMAANRPPGATADERFEKACFEFHADSWFHRPGLFGAQHERIGRLRMSQVDSQGRSMSIEILRGDDTPAFVFVEHEDELMQHVLCAEITARLSAAGVRPR